MMCTVHVFLLWYVFDNLNFPSADVEILPSIDFSATMPICYFHMELHAFEL